MRRCPTRWTWNSSRTWESSGIWTSKNEVENITSAELSLITPEVLEESPDLTDDLAMDLEGLPSAEDVPEDEGLGLELIDPDVPLTSIPAEDLPLADLEVEDRARLWKKPRPRSRSSRFPRPGS